MLVTERLFLRRWQDDHFQAFADMHADPDVMADLGGPIEESLSRHKFNRYRAAETEHGIARWAVEDSNEQFLGYAGVMPRMASDHPLGLHYEVGWRFNRWAWGKGYATESAKAALSHAAKHLPDTNIVSYTSGENQRSQAVMSRLGLIRTPAMDFTLSLTEGAVWHGLVWVVP